VKFSPLSSARSANQSTPLTSGSRFAAADEAESFGGTAPQAAPAAQTRRQRENRKRRGTMATLTRKKKPASEEAGPKQKIDSGELVIG